MSCPTDECNQCGAQRWAWKDNQLPKCSLDDCSSRPGGTPCCFKADDLCARLISLSHTLANDGREVGGLDTLLDTSAARIAAQDAEIERLTRVATERLGAKELECEARIKAEARCVEVMAERDASYKCYAALTATHLHLDNHNAIVRELNARSKELEEKVQELEYELMEEYP